MSDLGDATADLYREVILDHNKRPRNFGRLPSPGRTARGDNPLCGDHLDLDVTIRDGRVAAIAFSGEGCAISRASASMMTEAVLGRTVAEAEALFSRFHALLTAEPASREVGPDLGKLAAFGGVREFPMRVKCATLAWHTLHSALTDEAKVVSTE